MGLVTQRATKAEQKWAAEMVSNEDLPRDDPELARAWMVYVMEDPLPEAVE
jgi:hypothetical protein